MFDIFQLRFQLVTNKGIALDEYNAIFHAKP